jgi:predicted HTH domain antitoxin
MSVVISDEVLRASEMTENELLKEIGIMLFQQEKISLGKASEVAKMNRIEFQRLLTERKINLHYDVAEFEEDLQQLHEQGWL